MAQLGTRAALYRGGTSKALLIRTDALPHRRLDELDEWLLALIGSPDPHQIDGIGGGHRLTSKVAIVGPSARAGADVDYTFAQIGVADATVDWSAMCGNITAAVAAFAVEEGMVPAAEPETVVRIHSTNGGTLVRARVAVDGGRPRTAGEARVDGVPGTGAPIVLDYCAGGGARTGRLLPTGRRRDRVQLPGFGTVECSVLDLAGVHVFIRAAGFGLTGHEEPAAIDARPDVVERIDQARRAVAARIGLDSARSRPLEPLTVLVADDPYAGADVTARACGPLGAHRAFPGTGAIATGVAAALPGTVVHAGTRAGAHPGPYLVGHPAGAIEVDAAVSECADGVRITRASLVSTARRLFEGIAFAEPSRLRR